MIDRQFFFGEVREHLFRGSMSGAEVDGTTRVLDEWERRSLTEPRWLSYMLATDYHETWRTMVPIRERGSESYLRAKPYYPWVGEGLVQVTWEENARKFGARKPGDLLGWPDALDALFEGMINGMFTGRGLPHYFGPGRDDPVGARRIINGQDDALLIAGFHHVFLHALTPQAQREDGRASKPAPPPQPRTGAA